jgi:MATE family multidrug resistance protein
MPAARLTGRAGERNAPPMDKTVTAANASRTEWLAEARALLTLGVPLAATQIAQMLILATDTAMLGHFSKDALAAAALGNTLFFLVWLLGCGLPMAVAPVIAHIQGEYADDELRGRRPVRAAVRMGLWSVALSLPVLMLPLYFTQGILIWLGEDAALAAGAARFMTGLAWVLPFALAFQVLRSFSTALSRTIPPLIVMGSAVLCNALGDYALIFGHFGLPRLGLLGAGLASACSNFFCFIVMLGFCLLAPTLRDYHILHRLFRPHWRTLGELFRLGLPMGVTMVFEVAFFNGATLAMGAFGTASIAAHQIAITIPSLTFMVPLGIGMAASVRVGMAMGAGDGVRARRAGLTAIGMAMGFMCGTALLLLFFPRAIAGIWLPDTAANAQVLALAVTFLHVAAAFQLMDGVQVTAAFSLRGLKDARMPMWLAGASYWLAGAPMCALLGFGLGLKGLGVWLGLAFGLLVAAILLSGRFIWLSKVVREHD